ncbi:trigger factor [Leucothrix arctica]|uniref:Trigger factor n=1 Tax=Leucothrix arctica TaxID=1481894 RepID=A0A317C3V5_9GAMM|nr:trigger factor [Leucothrix arctica]PWQ92959.1 trigger factor [Leucothrix arctica]
MQVSVESTGNIERKLTITVPAAQIDADVESRLKSMRGRVKVDGFRPGKVPLSVVSQQYGDSVYQEVLGETFQKTFSEAIEQEKLRVAGQPEIAPESLERGQDLVYVATVDIYPEFEIAPMADLEIKRPVATISDEDVDTMIENLRSQQKEWTDVERAAADGDTVKINFVGSLDGELFDGGSAEDFSVELGAGRMLKDFEEGLVGMSKGEEKEITVSFPEDYQAENLKGKDAQFKLTVNEVKEATLPEVDDAFIEKFGVDAGDLEAFRAEIRSNMQRELEQAIKNRVKQSVMDGLSDLHEIDLPKALVTQEVGYVRNEMAENAGGADMSSLPDDLFKEQASRRVKLGLIVGEIVTKNELKSDPSKVDDMLNTLASTYEDPQQLIEYYKTNPQAMQTIQAAVMEEMIVEWVIGQAKVTDEEVAFTDLMNPQQQAAA